MQSLCSIFAYGTPYYLAGRVFYGRSDVFLIKSLFYKSVNMLMPGNKLLEGGFINEQDLVPVITSPVEILSGKFHSLLFHCGC